MPSGSSANQPRPGSKDSSSVATSDSPPPSGDDRAPLGSGASAYDPSLDGTSIASNFSDGVRPTDKSQLTPEAIAHALQLKSDANKRFTASQYQDALDLYTLSINALL